MSDRTKDSYRKTVKHEAVHVISFLSGLDNLPRIWPDVWFSEGIAVYVSQNVPPIESLARLNEWREVPGNENPIKIHDWQGNRVIFPIRQFDHAFSEASNYRTSAGVHDLPFSKRRARHILWIKEVLSGSKGTIERRAQMRRDSRGQQ